MDKQRWITAAIQQGIEDVEIYEQKSTSTSIEIFEQKVDSFHISERDGVSIRGLYQGKMGNCFLEELCDENLEFAISQIKANASTITSDNEVKIRGYSPTYPQIKQHVNTCIDVSDDVKIKRLLELEQQVLAYDRRIVQVMGSSYTEYQSSRHIVNSKGIDLHDESSTSTIVVQVMVKDGADVKNDYVWQYLHNIDDIDIPKLVKEVCEKALAKLHATSVSSGSYPVLIQNKAMADLFGMLSGMFHGEDVYKGVSILKDKLEKPVFAKCIHIVDDPLLDYGMHSMAFDDEGSACQRTVLVDQGVLKGYLHNMKSAALMHTETTGNGLKAGYAGNIGISATNIAIENGVCAYETMVASMQKGIIITDMTGLHAGLNPISTEFSIQSQGFYVENGVVVHPVHLITVAGNFMDMMKHVAMLGNDGALNMNGVRTPSILFQSLSVSGE